MLKYCKVAGFPVFKAFFTFQTRILGSKKMTENEKPLSTTPGDQGPPLTPEKVQRQLRRILASPEFHATRRQREFLHFVVTETIAGRAQEIKAFTVATRVFGRKEDFDQSLDPIVSIQANGLRRALERYYLVAGKQDPLRIDIPRGTYVPTFRAQTGTKSDRTALASKIPDVSYDGSWPSVLIRPFQNLTGDPEKDFLRIGLATELATELSCYQDIRVSVDNGEGDEKASSDRLPRFTLDGNIRKDREGIKVVVQLFDTTTNTHLWGEVHRSGLEPGQLIVLEEQVARSVAAKTAGERGIISRTLSVESRGKPPSQLKTYEAILRYYEYDLTLAPDSFLRALEALEHAARIEPDCGQVWTMLGRLYANIYSLDIPGFEKPLEKAIEYAEKGTRMNRDDQRARAVLGLVRMFSNEIPAAREEIDKALALSPNSLFMLDGIGYIMTLVGEWEKGPALIREVIRLNPFYNTVVHYALWEDCLRREDYEGAYLETMGLRRPAVFWYPLVKAATLGHLGRDQEGKQFVETLLKLRPDFPTRGRILIGHYIKFEEIVERVIDGLRKSGLNSEDALSKE
jgi:adenylate cyclase